MTKAEKCGRLIRERNVLQYMNYNKGMYKILQNGAKCYKVIFVGIMKQCK